MNYIPRSLDGLRALTPSMRFDIANKLGFLPTIEDKIVFFMAPADKQSAMLLRSLHTYDKPSVMKQLKSLFHKVVSKYRVLTTSAPETKLKEERDFAYRRLYDIYDALSDGNDVADISSYVEGKSNGYGPERIFALKRQLRRLQLGETIESDKLTETEIRLQVEVDKLKTEKLRQYKLPKVTMLDHRPPTSNDDLVNLIRYELGDHENGNPDRDCVALRTVLEVMCEHWSKPEEVRGKAQSELDSVIKEKFN